MPTLLEQVKTLSVKLRRVVWQWRGAYVTHANLTGYKLNDRCKLGVVLSGGEFTPGGTYGDAYGYPSTATIDYYAANGMKIIRLPFLWERVQPSVHGQLDFMEMARISVVVNYAISKGMQVGLDLHNDGKGFGEIIGSVATPDDAFADVWLKLALFFKNTPEVIFMIMSEPSQQCAQQWIKSANAAVAVIRGAGATQLIVIPGSYYDGAWLWTISDNAAVVGKGVVDPLNNYMFEVHQYLDKDASGGSASIVSGNIGADRLAAITTWARMNGHQLFLGEFATAADEGSLIALDTMLEFIQENGDVWRYATWWGAGERWPGYMFHLDPTNGVDTPQMKKLLEFM